MLHHIVWLKRKAETDETQMTELLGDIRALAHAVPGVVSVHAGRNLTDRALGYDYGVNVVLSDPEALQPYLDHPAHQAVGARLRACCEVLAMDFEDP
ncbi:MAG: Dabb family protein [Pseudomonadota bacterium]